VIDKKLTRLKEGEYICSICGLLYKDHHGLAKHRRTKHKVEAQEKKPEEPKKRDQKLKEKLETKPEIK